MKTADEAQKTVIDLSEMRCHIAVNLCQSLLNSFTLQSKMAPLSLNIFVFNLERKKTKRQKITFFPFIQQTFSRISITNKTSVRSIPLRILSFQFCVPKNVGLAKQAGLERDSQDCRHNQVWNYMIRESYPWR